MQLVPIPDSLTPNPLSLLRHLHPKEGEGAPDLSAVCLPPFAFRRGGSGARTFFFLLALTPFTILFADQGTKKTSFSREVAPILKAHCASCHSGASAAAGLDVTSGKLLLKGHSVVPGHPDTSILLVRIKGLGGKPQMPMGLPPLTAADTATIEKWIAEGAQLDAPVAQHWAYVAPVRPKLPPLKSAWVRNAIDAFVLARQKKEGLHPSPEASREVLLRRVSLDLTGLPPTPTEIDAFLADKRPDAYERVVDRLLASPQYGEKQARSWLDLARYADSNGYEKDLRRTAWPYRDWVIDAFNRNMPYDQFTIKQLAGDLLPNSTLQDKVATGFHRNTMFNEEGGVDQAEAHFAVITDRVDTTATVWLGSTMACSRCHDHKYDPFTQKDYYRLAAFFTNTEVYPRGPKSIGEEKWFEAETKVPSKEQAAEQAKLNALISEKEKALTTRYAGADAAFEAWAAAALTQPTWTTLRPTLAIAPQGVNLVVQPDESILATGANPDRGQYHLAFPASPQPITGFRLEALSDPSLPSNGPGRAGNGNFVVSRIQVAAGDLSPVVANVKTDFLQAGLTLDRLNVGDDTQGWAVDGQIGKRHEMMFSLSKPIPAGTAFSVTLGFESRFGTHTLGHFRLSLTSAAEPVSAYLPDKIRSLLQAGAKNDELRNYYQTTAPPLAEPRLELALLKKKQEELEASVPTALVMKEKPAKGPLTCFVRHRGSFLDKAEEVTAGTPAVLPAPKKEPANRLDLAKWLVDPKNPLTARVEVNRIWESYFGRGLVETSEDFGTRGTRPTHPELLDWLATEFVAKGWDMKALHRLIVTSSTYRQSSSATAALIAKDPQNLLLARGPRFRMEAETIRDAALAASGLLNLKIGGPSVYPYQPEGVWDSPYSGEAWMPSKGADRFRRSIYTFWKRTSTYPAYMAFDATSRESCTVRRIRTNTPLQALTLLNDQEMIDAAKSLGNRMRGAAKATDARLVTGFRLCTGRKPRVEELGRLKQLLSKLESRYAQHPAEAKKLGAGPEDAAWTMVGNVLLNLDETITKG
ncbi:PSD1 and planctomycete cytochrome C domain-containing protein [Fimbriimonas ginsengisoli]|uniref:Cytochrome c domain-containing protein n=1 Tax=Fimbriimonas ginsengisoli Gsoil 348 TaxID=661478 RepID=A0A068NRZ7_FIMGI|nr:PSD1 and planctomycete cytochrome C domain-containing protein [Fimbriimonas ginsengisoli]AIE86097.1 hypothetical protein OP10G_2729 [Fimbriimonas ginsengisoli Gsoil 348]